MSLVRVVSIVALLSAMVVQGCSGNNTSVPLFSLEASGDVSLVCARVTRRNSDVKDVLDASIVSIEQCTSHQLSPSDPEILANDPCVVGTPPEGYTTDCELSALITQLFTGEIAAINITRGGIVFDLNQQIPGATFVSAGERPSAIAVSPINPEHFFVSNFGSKTILSIPTKFALAFPGEVAGGAQIDVAQGPTDLVMTPGDSSSAYLYAALKADGTVLEVLANPTTGEITGPGTSLALDGVAAQVQAPELGADDDYYRYCQPNRGPRTVTVNPRTPIGETAAALPNKLSIDAANNVLLVADAGRPFIHRFQLSEAGVTATLDPIHVGVPTRDVVVTPAVPASVRDGGGEPNADATQRFLYAIDDTDGSILVVDYTEGSPTFGAVLPVSSGDVPDRIDLGRLGTARSLAVLTPDYDPDTIAEDVCNLTNTDEALEATPQNLRGVFVAVATSNALVHIIDVFDLNATCRGGSPEECADPANSSDVVVSIRRSRPRIGNLVTVDLDITSGPSLRFLQSAGNIDEATGSIDDNPLAPSLEPVACETPSRVLFGNADLGGGDVGPVYICGNDEPWVAPSQRWDAVWEGPIPFAEGAFGKPEERGDQNWFTAQDGLFCLRGVLGEDNAEGTSPEPGREYIGDRLIITGDLPELTRIQAEMMSTHPCAMFLENSENFEDEPVAFPILESYMGELRLGESLDPDRYTFDDVLLCFDELVTYAVATQEVYTVVGSITGFLHRVTTDDPANPVSRCFVDPALPVIPADPATLLNGRAFPDLPYQNPLISFEIGQFPQFPEPIQTGGQVFMTFTTNNRTQELDLLTGLLPTGQRVISLPETLVYSPLDDFLYLADVSAGFGIIQLQPLAFVRYFR